MVFVYKKTENFDSPSFLLLYTLYSTSDKRLDNGKLVVRNTDSVKLIVTCKLNDIISLRNNESYLVFSESVLSVFFALYRLFLVPRCQIDCPVHRSYRSEFIEIDSVFALGIGKNETSALGIERKFKIYEKFDYSKKEEKEDFVLFVNRTEKITEKLKEFLEF